MIQVHEWQFSSSLLVKNFFNWGRHFSNLYIFYLKDRLSLSCNFSFLKYLLAFISSPYLNSPDSFFSFFVLSWSLLVVYCGSFQYQEIYNHQILHCLRGSTINLTQLSYCKLIKKKKIWWMNKDWISLSLTLSYHQQFSGRTPIWLTILLMNTVLGHVMIYLPWTRFGNATFAYLSNN